MADLSAVSSLQGEMRPCFLFLCCCSLIVNCLSPAAKAVLWTCTQACPSWGNFTGPQLLRGPRDATDDDSHITCVQVCNRNIIFGSWHPNDLSKLLISRWRWQLWRGHFTVKSDLRSINCFISIVCDVLFWCGWGRRPLRVLAGSPLLAFCGSLPTFHKSLTWKETR